MEESVAQTADYNAVQRETEGGQNIHPSTNYLDHSSYPSCHWAKGSICNENLQMLMEEYLFQYPNRLNDYTVQLVQTLAAYNPVTQR